MEENSDISFSSEDEETKALEAVEFGWEDERKVSGRRKKIQKAIKNKTKPGTFGAMGLSAKMLDNITKVCKFKLPSPIQRKTIPFILQGSDVVGMARTGSGKTAAFVIPMIERLKEHSKRIGARALIISPTRELALQTFSVIKKISKGFNLMASVLVGGDAMNDQFMQLASNPDIIIATPGRLAHMLNEVHAFSLKLVEFVVFDEADRLFEMGFAPQIAEILAQMGENRQTLLFSATMPKLLAEFTKSGLHDPEVVRLDTESMLSPNLQLFFFTLRQEDKAASLAYLLREVIPYTEASIIFASTKHHVAYLQQLLERDNITVSYVFGSMDQTARKIEIAKFRSKNVNVLIVTDVAARGIDLPLVDNVIHYDFPPTPKLFVHRSGRTARAGKSGKAYSFLTRDEIPYLLDLHIFLSRPIKPAVEVPSDSDTPLDFSAFYGRLPEQQLCTILDIFEKRLHDCEELSKLRHTAENGYKMYLRSRPGASPASVKRAKDLPKEGLHPLFTSKASSSSIRSKNDIERIVLTNKIKEFRPEVSVFVRKVALNKNRPKKNKNKKEANKPKIEEEVKVIKQPKLEYDCFELGKYKNKEFYINYERDEYHKEKESLMNKTVDSSIIEILGEDKEGLGKRKKQFFWDKGSRRYVCLPVGEEIRHGRRVKSDTGIKDSKKSKVKAGAAYQRWSRTERAEILNVGTQENENLTSIAKGALQKIGKKFKYHGGNREIENKNVKDEIKSFEQIHKARVKKGKMREKNTPQFLRNKIEGRGDRRGGKIKKTNNKNNLAKSSKFKNKKLRKN